METCNEGIPSESPANLVNITRDDVIPGLLRAFRRKTFDSRSVLSVKFVGEDGADQGGLRAECITLAYRQIAQSKNICQGAEADGKLLVKDEIGRKHLIKYYM